MPRNPSHEPLASGRTLTHFGARWRIMIASHRVAKGTEGLAFGARVYRTRSNRLSRYYWRVDPNPRMSANLQLRPSLANPHVLKSQQEACMPGHTASVFRLRRVVRLTALINALRS